VAVEGHNIGELSMKKVARSGLDIAKHVFQTNAWRHHRILREIVTFRTNDE